MAASVMVPPTGHTGDVYSHPLDPLRPAELQRASDLVKRHAASIGAGELRFNTVQLKVSLHDCRVT